MKATRFLFLWILLTALLIGSVTPLLGQGDVILTLTVPQWMNDVFDEALFSEFEVANPGVTVQLSEVRADPYYGVVANDLEEYLNNAEEYVASGDVVYVGSSNLSPFSTRAGYFLNLAPLIETDPTFNEDDFFPTVWQSVQWDRGIWGIPVTAYTLVVLYDVDAFDEAGLTYPDETWTIDQFVHAARELTQKNANGVVELPGFGVSNPAYFARALLGEGFYDGTMLPSPPYFGNPELPALLETWMELQNEITPEGNVDYNEVPLTMGTPRQIVFSGLLDERNLAAALLPGGTAGLDIQGFAVSGGTQYPELAYELAKYLSGKPEVITRFFADTPARRSLVGEHTEDDLYAVFGDTPPEIQAIIDKAVINAFPASELRFTDYLNVAIQKIKNDQLAIPIALQEAETEALTALETAEQRGSEVIITVATPIPPPQIAEGKIILDFGITLYGASLPNRDKWDQLMNEFVASHPQVGSINFKSQNFMPAELEELDCYYYPVNNVPSLKLSTLVSLDPFLDADPMFDSNDVLGDTMQQLQRENRTWAYPINLQPMVLLYDYERFLRDGVPEPEGSWSIDAFNDALEILRSTSETGNKLFVPQSFGNQYLLMLVAAYGGVPYDYTINPPTINFTDPVNLDAIHQVLDLAKDGYLDYQQLATLRGGAFGNEMEGVPILGETLSSISTSYLLGEEEERANTRRIASYPSGSLYVPVSYDIGSAYISVNAENPQACYDWITTIAQHPELFAGIPPRRSMLSDPAIIAAQGEDVTAFYDAFVALLDAPNRLIFPGSFSSGDSAGPYIEQMWLNEAFDNYVLHDGDLEADLADAEMYIQTFRECAADIPPIGEVEYRTQMDGIKYIRRFTDCAIEVDPDQKQTYAIFYMGEDD